MATPPTSSPALYVDEQRQIVECGHLRAGRACRSMNGIGDAQAAAMMQQALGMSLPWRHSWPSQRQADQAAGTATDAAAGVRGAAAQRRVHWRPSTTRRSSRAHARRTGAPAATSHSATPCQRRATGATATTSCRRPRWRPAEPNEKEKKKKIRGILDIFLVRPT